MGGYLFWLSNPWRLSLIKPLRVFVCTPIKFQRYSKEGKAKSSGHVTEERASSTADEFQRVAEEKARAAAEQGVASQNVEKAYDGAEEAIHGDSKIESVMNRYKEHEEGADHRRSGDDH